MVNSCVMNGFIIRLLFRVTVVLTCTAIAVSQDPNEDGELNPAGVDRDLHTRVTDPEALLAW